MRRAFLCLLIIAGGTLLASCTRQGTVSQTNTQNTNASTNISTNSAAPTENSTIADSRERMRLAQVFAERFGSFSNESNFANLEELQIMMSAPMRSWSEGVITAGRQNPSSPEYYGITTIARGVKEVSSTDTTAQYVVTTQRVERTADAERIYYQDITIRLLKEASVWKVDSAQWVPLSSE